MTASGLSCGMQDLSLWCAGSSLQHTGFSLVVACGFSLSSCGAQAPGHMGSVVCGMQSLYLRRTSSVVVAHGLSCPVACGILIPWPGIEPTSPALQGRLFITGPPGKSLHVVLISTYKLRILCLLRELTSSLLYSPALYSWRFSCSEVNLVWNQHSYTKFLFCGCSGAKNVGRYVNREGVKVYTKNCYLVGHQYGQWIIL